MKRVTWLVVSAIAFAAATSANAQGYVRPQTNPYGTPAISPYLNLARPGAPGLNYFNLVQPQLETQNQLQLLQTTTLQTQAALQAEIADPTRRVTDTGHTTRFMSYNQYFQNVGGQHPTSPAITAPVIATTANTLNRGGR
jgi:hypothetical protein